MMTPNSIVSTYRLQLRPEFPFAAAQDIIPYLRDLGITTLYLSPIFLAQRGSSHGYDCIDMNEANPELGGLSGFQDLVKAAKAANLNIILDIVPNHRVYSCQNSLLMEVLRDGRNSRYAPLFDINWDHHYENLRGRILAPFLGDLFADCLVKGQFKIKLDENGLTLTYFDWHFPVRPESILRILQLNQGATQSRLGKSSLAVTRFNALVGYLVNLESERALAPDFDHGALVRDLLWEIYTEFDEIRSHVDANIAQINGIEGDMESFNDLSNLIKEQHYRPSFWKVGTEEINYRRFFTINELISLRTEDPAVFAQTHRWVIELLNTEAIAGVRIDHIDGLKDPTTYLQRFHAAAPRSSIFVEKILHPGENLPKNWPIDGTTGYDHLAATTHLLCDPQKAHAFDTAYRTFTGQTTGFAQIELECKRAMIEKGLPGDIDNLATLLKDIASRRRYGMDLTMHALHRALRELLAQFRVYRTYLTLESYRTEDRQEIETVIAQCKRALPHHEHEFDLIQRCILAPFDPIRTLEEKQQWFDFALRLQQYTSPVMAKSVEDTAFYRYARLLALNEVGSDPRNIGMTLRDFHRFNSKRRRSWPQSLNTLTTHDTKRGEDARARLCVLSEQPSRWSRHLRTWSRVNQRHHQGETPTRVLETFIYQSILASIPFAGLAADDFIPRLKAYLIKACREAKVHTDWQVPNETFETSLHAFVDCITDSHTGGEFLQSFLPFAQEIAAWGFFNSLTQTTLRLTAPGVPDTYQGTELWDLSFVDPDNRRSVDFSQRAKMLAKTKKTTGPLSVPQTWTDGVIKLRLLQTLLSLRRDHPEIVSHSYHPVTTRGSRSRQLIAFQRGGQGQLLVVAPRLLSTVEPLAPLATEPFRWSEVVANAFNETVITLARPPTPAYRDILSGRTYPSANELSVADLLRDFPIAVLLSV